MDGPGGDATEPDILIAAAHVHLPGDVGVAPGVDGAVCHRDRLGRGGHEGGEGRGRGRVIAIAIAVAASPSPSRRGRHPIAVAVAIPVSGR